MPRNATGSSAAPSSRTVRAIALIEWLKGALALIGTSALLAVGAQGVNHALDRLAKLAPYDAVHRAVAAVIRHVDGGSVLFVATFLAAYAGLRCVEGWGLWRGRAWASLLGAVSVALYLPFDLYAFGRDPGAASAALVAVNMAMLWILAHDLAARRRAALSS